MVGVDSNLAWPAVMAVMIHFAVFADLALLALAAVNAIATAMAGTIADVASDHSLTHI